MNLKKCTSCLLEKETTCFHARSMSNDGLNARCKTCVKVASRKYYLSNKESINKKNREYGKNNRKKLSAKNKVWVSKNREKSRAIKSKWKESHPEHNKAINRNWALNNKERVNENQRKWRLDNLEHCREKGREYNYKRRVERAAYQTLREARKIQATPLWADISAIKDVYKEARYFQMEVDHIIPLRGKDVCGLHIWDNLQLLTARDNQIKGNRFNLEDQR